MTSRSLQRHGSRRSSGCCRPPWCASGCPPAAPVRACAAPTRQTPPPCGELERLDQLLTRSAARRAVAPSGCPRAASPDHLPITARRDGDRGGDPAPPGDRRLGRHRLGEVHPAPQVLPRGRARGRRADRPHPAPADRRPDGRPPHRRGTRRAARPLGRLQDPLPGHHPGGGLHQDHDRRDPPGRGGRRPPALGLRHAHRRRGPRAQPQHRLHPGLPAHARRTGGATCGWSSPRPRSTRPSSRGPSTTRP